MLASVLLSACGSKTDSAKTATSAAVGADTGASADDAASRPSDASGCAAAVASTLGGVGERIYREAGSGLNIEQAVRRVQSSTALVSAITNGDAEATRGALEKLLVNQIVRIQILRAGHVFASAGSEAALAPVRGSIPNTDATFILSTQSDRAFVQVTQQVTGARILLFNGSRAVAGTTAGALPANVPTSGTLKLAGKSYRVYAVSGRSFPSEPLRIAVLVPSSAIACRGPADQAHVETLGHVGERIYQQELHSKYTLATARHIERDPGFQRAVAARDVAATRTAIVGFFAAHIHVVRVRVSVPGSSDGEKLLIDLGGPYVLAPVHGTVRSAGDVVGHFTMAIQDDAGYLKLARLFTGADVLMRTAAHQVMGTLDPGPASVPDRGAVSYRGRTYEAYSFTAEAFPSGPLRISLLIGANS